GSGLNTFNKHALEQIANFYAEYEKFISDEAARIKTFEYDGDESSRRYTRAKIVDMIFFIEGLKMAKNEKNAKKTKNNK
ncbi:MAG: hypothetical protein AAB634_03570, partial [Patescibacteria group bacterium]